MAKRNVKTAPARPAAVAPTDVFEMTFRAMYESLGSKLNAQQIMELFRSHGYHHYLMEIMAPETKDLKDMDYGNALDAFEGDLMAMMEHAVRNSRKR